MEPHYKGLGTMKTTLLHEVSHYILITLRKSTIGTEEIASLEKIRLMWSQ